MWLLWLCLVIFVLVIVLGQQYSMFSKDTLIIFLTHNFKPEFKKLLSRTRSNNTTDVVVLFDESSTQWEDTDFNVIREKRMENVLYDNLGKGGHTMYLNYFNKNDIRQYKYIWIVENDVFYPGSLHEIVERHSEHDYDLLVPEYGVRDSDWMWLNNDLKFENIQQIGVIGVIMRFSTRLASRLYENKDRGFFEAFLPHYCIEQSFTIQTFIPDTIGAIDIFPSEITKNIEENPYKAEHKLYHPIKI